MIAQLSSQVPRANEEAARLSPLSEHYNQVLDTSSACYMQKHTIDRPIFDKQGWGLISKEKSIQTYTATQKDPQRRYLSVPLREMMRTAPKLHT